MLSKNIVKKYVVRAVAAASLLSVGAALALDKVTIQVSNYNEGMSGGVWAVALEKGFLKDQGLDVEVRSSTGGASDIRALIAGDLTYVETGVAATLAAATQQNLAIKIVSDNVQTLGSTFWFALSTSSVNSLKDLKGHRLGYSAPKSATQMVNMMLMKKMGFSKTDVTLVAAGGLAPSLTMLEANALDVVTAGNQFFYAAPPGKYKLIGKVSKELPPITNVVGVSSDKAIKERPEIIRKLIAARRKAVEFTEANPNEAADIMARTAKWDISVTRKAVADLVGTGFWSPGSFGKEDMQNAVESLVVVEALPATVDWKKYVDEQFLPADLRTLSKK